jgi:hypothetical protein
MVTIRHIVVIGPKKILNREQEDGDSKAEELLKSNRDQVEHISIGTLHSFSVLNYVICVYPSFASRSALTKYLHITIDGAKFWVQLIIRFFPQRHYYSTAASICRLLLALHSFLSRNQDHVSLEKVRDLSRMFIIPRSVSVGMRLLSKSSGVRLPTRVKVCFPFLDLKNL